MRLSGRLSETVRGLGNWPGRPKADGLIGYVDQIAPTFVRGWAADRNQPGVSLDLRVYIDNQLVALGPAAIKRDDLKVAGYGDGEHGFHFLVPTKAVFCGDVLTISALIKGEEKLVVRQNLHRPRSRTTPSLYLDASDLIEFLTHHRELSGIQRVQAGYLLNLGDATIAGMNCQICARFKFALFYWDIPFARFVELMRNAGNSAAVSDAAWPGYVQAFKESLQTRSAIGTGDTIFTMGAPWALEQHNDLIRCLKLHYGASYLQIFYDLIPISVPEYVAAPLIPHFARSMAAMTIYAEHVFSISQYSIDDLKVNLEKVHRAMPDCSVIPMGGSITDADLSDHRATDKALIGINGPFVLCVGTLEPRKNHMLLFQIWRRLVAKHGASRVPKLVLVGRVGWYMDDFMRILKATDFVEQTIIHLQGVSNAELSSLYDGCLFTIFPSFSEGWGLPITESLARGKVCVCSDATSMPEAGGDDAIYIDPHNASAAFALCETLIFDGKTLAEKDLHLRASFRTTTWSDASGGLRREMEAIADRLKTKKQSRKPIELGRFYRFYATWAAEPDALALRVFENFLDQEDATDLLARWNWFDIDVHCTWACGPDAELCLIMPLDTPNDLVAYIEVVTPPSYENVGCTVMVDGIKAGRFLGGDTRIMVPLSGVAAGQLVSVRFSYEESRGPVEDLRYLGLGIRTIVVHARDDLAGRLRHWEEKGLKQI